MQEAFRKAELGKNKETINISNPTTVTILKAAYRKLGIDFFETTVVPNYGKGREIKIPVYDHLKVECLDLHPRLTLQPVKTRAYILEGLTDGMRLSEERLHPAYKNYFDIFGEGVRVAMENYPYSRPSNYFLYGLVLLYSAEVAKQYDLLGFIRNQFEGKIGHEFIGLPQVRIAVANWAGGANIK